MDFCQKLLQFRPEKRVTQETVAMACDMMLRQYHHFEKGEQRPGFNNLRNVADFYEVLVDWLMDRTKHREVWR